MQTWIMSKCDKISALSSLFHLSINIMRGGPPVQRKFFGDKMNFPPFPFSIFLLNVLKRIWENGCSHTFLSGLPLLLFDHQRTLLGVVRHDQHGAGRDDRQDSADHLHLLQCWLLLGSSSLQGDLIQDGIKIFLTNIAVLSR